MEHGALKVFAVLYVSWTLYFLTEGRSCSCANDGGCVFLHACAPDGNCNKENVAWGKPANTSSRYNSDTGYSGPACVANNGRLGTTIVNINYSEPNCIHTDNNDNRAWWEVYLGRLYTITGVTIYRREDSEWPQVVRRMSGIGVYVSGKLCYKFPPSTEILALDALPARIDVTCSQPITGDVVKLAKDGSDIDPAFYIINVCEVQLWVCKSGLYGENCAKHCSDKCRPGFDCDNFNGTCLEVCADGYYGDDCSRQCGRCKSSEPCNKSTGECSSGCETGYLPPFCETTDGDSGQGTTTVTTTETLTTETETNLLAPLLGVFGALLAVAVIVLVGFCIWRRRQRSKGDHVEMSSGLPDVLQGQRSRNGACVEGGAEPGHVYDELQVSERGSTHGYSELHRPSSNSSQASQTFPKELIFQNQRQSDTSPTLPSRNRP